GRIVGGERGIDQGSRLQLPWFLVVDHLLDERLADALRHAAVNLPLDDRRVDDVSAVINRNIFLNLDRTSLGIDLDHADVGTEGPDEIWRIEVGHRFQPLLHALRQASAVCRESDLAECLGLVRAPLDMELALVENNVLLGCLEDVRGQLPGLVDDLAGGAADGDPTHREASTARGSIAHGGAFAGLPVPKLDA